MEILHRLYQEIIGFLGIDAWLEMFGSGNYSRLGTFDGVLAAIGPLIPLLLIIELLRGLLLRRFAGPTYRTVFFIYVFNRVLGTYISIGVYAFLLGKLWPHALLKTSFTWYWLIYGYVVWELGHFFYHYLAHKVRLLWCLHSTHHAPESMNLAVTHAHFFLEAPYADLIRVSVCFLLGVNPPLLGFIMFIDGTWGAFIHVGENLLRDGRLGGLHKILLTPAHHRVHHARNPLYMDRNFCNLLNIWDRVFGTLQQEDPALQIEYGITRPVKAGSFWDVYFGEIVFLARDIGRAPSLRAALLYLVMPPGWSPTGDHKTARRVREQYLQEKEAS